MRYNNDWIKEKYNKGEDIAYLFFWGHTPPKDGSTNKSCLSQWFASTFVKDGYSYATAEHWMMAEKARLFNDEATLEEILQAMTPHEAKALGRKVRNFDDAVWKAHRYNIVLEGNRLKFTQNDALRQYLIDTANTVIVEASPYDRIWGIGMKASDDNIDNPYQWKGSNLLGWVLMDVRDELKLN
ncbi:MAG: NADAR family protein [Bacteroidota bacterium]